MAFGEAGMEFYLGHHTFNHESISNVTYSDALQQIRLNQVGQHLQLPYALFGMSVSCCFWQL